ncbi:DUF1871 family protein [Alicyclobacillus sp. ALC3]|uniref:DUF1871 family protein n=1 Tax=Alicyclobacillus sp. ALC3 TaxID=2796143 RepID=UPI00237899CE|nr:DUF1871 family protein [Alicyclobacillus sp. ALC3]WDL96212.1 DUF1871 family protein [Alicyclobacillus sp. ALC3]
MSQEELIHQSFAAVREVINEWDPVGLHPGAFAPVDEYDPEVSEIVAFVGDTSLSVGALGERVYKVFETWFGEDMTYCFPLEECENVAVKLKGAVSK